MSLNNITTNQFFQGQQSGNKGFVIFFAMDSSSLFVLFKYNHSFSRLFIRMHGNTHILLLVQFLYIKLCNFLHCPRELSHNIEKFYHVYTLSDIFEPSKMLLFNKLVAYFRWKIILFIDVCIFNSNHLS